MWYDLYFWRAKYRNNGRTWKYDYSRVFEKCSIIATKKSKLIRNLAKDLRISILTVKKAYDELEQEAYIKTVQGKGTFVTPRNTELIREKQISIIEEHIEQIINIAKISNISKNEIIDLFNYLYEEE